MVTESGKLCLDTIYQALPRVQNLQPQVHTLSSTGATPAVIPSRLNNPHVDVLLLDGFEEDVASKIVVGFAIDIESLMREHTVVVVRNRTHVMEPQRLQLGEELVGFLVERKYESPKHPSGSLGSRPSTALTATAAAYVNRDRTPHYYTSSTFGSRTTLVTSFFTAKCKTGY